MNAHLPGTRVKQSQHLGRARTEVFVRLFRWLTFRLPTRTGLWDRLEGTCFVLAPDLQTQLPAQHVGVLDQFFLASVSGSVTVTIPALRLRRTVPVRHQVRLSW